MVLPIKKSSHQTKKRKGKRETIHDQENPQRTMAHTPTPTHKKFLTGLGVTQLLALPLMNLPLVPLSSTPMLPSSLPPPNLWCHIPTDLGILICEYLEADSCGYLLMISKLWSILPTEKVYRQLCFQIFQSQTLKKILNVTNWGSWKNMLIHRPRLRTNGIYSLRTSYWKPPTNEKFWEEKIREFPETKFYRHLRFFDHGRLLYSLCNLSSREIHPLLQHFNPQPARKIFEGSYELMKDVVIVRVLISVLIPPPSSSCLL
jgi:F-box protein 9